MALTWHHFPVEILIVPTQESISPAFEKPLLKLGPILSPKIRVIKGFGDPKFLGHGSLM